MTDPRFNPATGHGVECLCNECMRLARAAMMDAELYALLRTTIVLRSPACTGDFPEMPRVITRVLDDGVKTKDGAA
jgi:hypothetical protein